MYFTNECQLFPLKKYTLDHILKWLIYNLCNDYYCKTSILNTRGQSVIWVSFSLLKLLDLALIKRTFQSPGSNPFPPHFWINQNVYKLKTKRRYMKKVSIELAEWLPRPSHAETHDRRDRGPTAFGSVRWNWLLISVRCSTRPRLTHSLKSVNLYVNIQPWTCAISG